MTLTKQNNFIILFLIIVVAAILRLVWLGQYPVSLSVDEVSIGYNAYSVLRTGMDQYQKPMPLVFASLGDYKPPVYIYMTAASEALFGVNEFAVRFPAASAGILSVFVTYLLALKLTGNKKIALLASFVFALSPWNIYLSRGAYEANVSLTLMLAGLYYFLDLKKPWLSLVLFVLAMHTYHTPKIFVPVLLIGLGFAYIKQIVGSKKHLLTLLIVGSLMFIPTFWLTFFSGGQTRAVQTLLSGDSDLVRTIGQTIAHQNFNTYWLTTWSTVNHFLQYFDPTYLFFKGLNLSREQIIDLGIGYLVELPFFLFGLYYAVTSKIFTDTKYKAIFWLWMLMSLLPASITLNDYHFIRTIPFLLPFILFIAVGLYKVHVRFPNLVVITVLGYVLGLAAFADYYLVHTPFQKSDFSFDPLKQVAQTALKYQNQYTKIIIDPEYGKAGPYLLGTPDLYILFYGKIDPRVFWNSKTSEGFGNFVFQHIEWSEVKNLHNTLLIGSPWSLPEKDIAKAHIKQRINFFNQTPAYLVVETP